MKCELNMWKVMLVGLSSFRITKALIDQDGPSWREKLPPIPIVPVAAQLHRWDGGNFTSENMPRCPIESKREQLPMNRTYSKCIFLYIYIYIHIHVHIHIHKKGKWLLGLLAKIKCNICSYQFNIWYDERTLH